MFVGMGKGREIGGKTGGNTMCGGGTGFFIIGGEVQSVSVWHWFWPSPSVKTHCFWVLHSLCFIETLQSLSAWHWLIPTPVIERHCLFRHSL